MILFDVSQLEVWICSYCEKYGHGSCYKIIENLNYNGCEDNLSLDERKSCLVGGEYSNNKPLFVRADLQYLDISDKECWVCKECKKIDKPCYKMIVKPNKNRYTDYISIFGKRTCLFGDLHKANFDRMKIYENG